MDKQQGSKVEVVSVEDDGYYADANTSGNCVKVTLQRGNEFVSCGKMLIWEEDGDELEGVFDEWAELAAAGEGGYTHWTN